MKKNIELQKKIIEKAIIVGVNTENNLSKTQEPLAELERLAATAEIEVLGKILQNRSYIHPRTYVGTGKVLEIKHLAEEVGANLILFDDDLTPAQARNLENELNRNIIDRTELILHIFASHAKTNESKLQVELAQLEYSLPRLKRMWKHLEHAEGGATSGAGSLIGTKGPGEKQLELDKRLIRKRIQDLTRTLKDIQARKIREVDSRNNRFFTIGIVGYTNAGKSTLMNLLTGADVLVEDKLFATLDTRTRLWNIDSGCKVMLSDTVGFIEKLPHHLVASFKSTLEEATKADMLLHVVDVSDIDIERHIQVVEQVLKDIGVKDKPILLVFNKIDLQNDSIELAHIKEKYPQHVFISAEQKWHITDLKESILKIWEKNMLEMDFILTPKDGKWISWLEEYTRVLSKVCQGEEFHYNVQISQANANWITEHLSINPSQLQERRSKEENTLQDMNE